MLFCSIWTLLAVAYLLLVPTRFPRFAHKFAIAAVEFITMIFWFAAFIAVAVRWNNAWWGYTGKGTFYSCGVAAIVFSAFLWLVSISRLDWNSAYILQVYIRCYHRSVCAAHPRLLPQRYCSPSKYGRCLSSAPSGYHEIFFATRPTKHFMIPFSFPNLLSTDCHILARRIFGPMIPSIRCFQAYL